MIFVKSKSRHANAQLIIKARGRHSFLTEMAVLTLETDYSCETGYPFDNLRQIGNTSL